MSGRSVSRRLLAVAATLGTASMSCSPSSGVADRGEPSQGPRSPTPSVAPRTARSAAGADDPAATWQAHVDAEQSGDANAARAAAQTLVDRWPDSPYAAYARRWLRINPAGSR